MYTIQRNRQVLRKPQRTPGRIKGKKGHPEKRTRRTPAHDFLRYTFSPILALPADHIPRAQAETHFFTSLRYVELAYKLPKTPVSDRPYPYNVLDAFRHVKQQVDAVDNCEKLMLIENGKYPYCLATASIWDTGYHLYHISFVALLHISRNRRYRKETALLTSACAYLCQRAGMPSYATGDGLAGIYDQVWDYLEQEHFDSEMDDSDIDERISEQERLEEHLRRERRYKNASFEMECANYLGSKMQKTLSHPYHLSAWQERLSRYTPRNEKQQQLHSLCSQLFDLYTRYPERRFFQQLCAEHWYSENDCLMPADLYLSFVWSVDGWLADEAYQQINDFSGSYDGADEPLQYKVYDTAGARPANNLDFEMHLLPLVDELAYLIYNF